jgi:hypothetical protein
MVLSDLKREQLDGYLATLTPNAAAQLLRRFELDRGRTGRLDPDGVIEQRLRLLIGEPKTRAKDHDGLMLREFAEPFEDMLSDRMSSDKQCGRIQRASIDRVWAWLDRDIMPDRLERLVKDVAEARARGEADRLAKARSRFYLSLAKSLLQVFGELEPNTKAYMRLASHIGGNAALEDAREMMQTFFLYDRIADLKAGLPDVIADPGTDENGEYAKLYRNFDVKSQGFGWIVLVAIMRRLENPAAIVPLAVSIAGTNRCAELRRHPVGVICGCALYDMRLAAEQAAGLIRDRSEIDTVLGHIGRFHALADAMTGTIDLDPDGQWGRHVTAVGKALARAIHDDISNSPRRVKSAIYCDYRGAGEAERGLVTSGPAGAALSEAAFSLRLLYGITPYLGQLPIKDEHAGLDKEIRQFIEPIADLTVERLRTAEPAETEAIGQYLRANVAFTGIVLGPEAAERLARRGRLVRQSRGGHGTA